MCFWAVVMKADTMSWVGDWSIKAVTKVANGVSMGGVGRSSEPTWLVARNGKGQRARLPWQTVSSRTAISEWFCLESQAAVPNCRPVKKNAKFPDFFAPALSFDAAEGV